MGWPLDAFFPSVIICSIIDYLLGQVNLALCVQDKVC